MVTSVVVERSGRWPCVDEDAAEDDGCGLDDFALDCLDLRLETSFVARGASCEVASGILVLHCGQMTCGL